MTKITDERIEELRRMNACSPALDWLKDKTIADLKDHPEWAFLSAKYYRGDVTALQAIVIAHGSPELRRKFADHVPGADRDALLNGI